VPAPFVPALAPWTLDSFRISCRRGLQKNPDCQGITLLAAHVASPNPAIAVLNNTVDTGSGWDAGHTSHAQTPRCDEARLRNTF